MNVPKILVLFVVFTAFAGASFAPAADPSVWPLMPYEVRVAVAMEAGAPFSPRLESGLLSDLTARIEAVVGAPWNAVVAPAPPELARAMLHGLGDLRPEDVSIPTPEPDKILFLAITASAEGMTATRDFDVRTRTLGPPVVRPVWQVGALSGASMDALLSAFAPLGRIDRVERDKDSMVLRIKAAGLPPRDPNLALVRAGDVFRPIVRRNDRDNKLVSLAPAKWSYAVVEKLSPEETQCRVYTGMKSELLMKGRGRVEHLALRVRPTAGGTELTLRSRTDPKGPLAGCDVYVYPPADKNAVSFLGQTDRRGRVFVPPVEGEPLRMLLVKNGSAALAKLPVVPGLDRTAVAELADDAPRLAAEGFLAGIEQELVDLVALRKILIAQIRARAKAKQFDKASELMIELRKLPGMRDFTLRVAREKGKLATKDPVVRKKIEVLLRNIQPQIEKYLSPLEIEETERFARQAREAGGNTESQEAASEDL